MAARWADDFSRYGTGNPSRAAMLDGLVYANLGAVPGEVTPSPDPNDAGRAFGLGIGQLRVALPTVVTGTLGVAFRFWLANLPTSAPARCRIINFLDAGGGTIVFVRVEQNGALTVHGLVGSTMTQLFDSVNPIVQPNSFNHCELVHDTVTGEGDVYINGILRASYTGVNTGISMVFAAFTNQDSAGAITNMWVKDLYIWDGTGSQNNSVAGTVIVRRFKPTDDVTLGGWSPSTGLTGFNLLSKDAPNDTTYLSADDSPPAPMSFNLENLPPDVTSVRAVFSVVRARKVDGGDANLQNALSPNGTDWDSGADRPITSAFAYYFDVSELDPEVAAPWAPLAFDGAQLRIDRTV